MTTYPTVSITPEKGFRGQESVHVKVGLCEKRTVQRSFTSTLDAIQWGLDICQAPCNNCACKEKADGS
jgi:hypothetical protein